MNEKQWLTCADPYALLVWLLDHLQPTDRQLRLFACACCRRLWNRLAHSASRHVIEVAERFADGQASEEERLAAWREAGQVDGLLAAAAAWTACSDAEISARRVIELAGPASSSSATEIFNPLLWSGENRQQADILRDVFGNPFRPVTVEPSWLAWNHHTIPQIAKSIYNERRFGDMPVLGDALEEAGCTNDEILDHCRNEKDHILGCWVIDLHLEKA